MKYVFLLAGGIQKLEGREYTIDSILKIIEIFTDWILRVWIAMSGVSLLIRFVMYAVVDVDQKSKSCFKTYM